MLRVFIETQCHGLPEDLDLDLFSRIDSDFDFAVIRYDQVRSDFLVEVPETIGHLGRLVNMIGDVTACSVIINFCTGEDLSITHHDVSLCLLDYWLHEEIE